MDTIQLQCGSCKKLMAISVGHLGEQVECPHCRSVVQTPTRQQVGLPPLAPAPEMRGGGSETESIFTGPEESDEVFSSGPTRPLIEMPPEPVRSPQPFNSAPTVDLQNPAYDDHPAPAPHEMNHDDHALPQPVLRSNYKPSMAPLMLLIFLVPYAILTTGFIIFLLMQFKAQPHPLDMLPDPQPDKSKGGTRRVFERVKHDSPLAAHQKATLGQSLRIGDLEVEPQKVILTSDGDLTLELRVKNVSTNTVFAPISDAYLLGKGGDLPYTFLEAGSLPRLYGGTLQFTTDNGRPRNPSLGDLRPGQHENILITTMPVTRDHEAVQRYAKTNEPMLWRVQLRRGFVEHRGKDISTTAIVGVQFTVNDITKEAG